MSRYSFSMPSHPGRKGWFRVGELEVTTTALMVALGVGSMFVYAVSKRFVFRGAFLGADVRSGEAWRLLTWPLVNPPDSFWVIITLVFFWFVGHRVEDEVGRSRFLVMLASAAIVSAAIVSAIPADVLSFAPPEPGAPLVIPTYASGLSLLAFGLLVVIAVRAPQEPWFFGIPVWVLAGVFGLVDVLRLVGDRFWGVLLLEVLVAVALVIGAAVYGLVDVLPFIPRAGAPRPARTGRAGKRRGRGRGGRGTVTQGPWSSPSGFGPPGPSRLEQAELDVLLDKIGQSGIASLSAEERRRLDDLSRRMRDT